MKKTIISLFFPIILIICICACDGSDDDSSIWIFTSELPDGRIIKSYSVILEARDAEGNVTWSLTVGSLPPGLELQADGKISGEPVASGYYTFTVKAQDSEASTTKELAINVPHVVLMSGFEPFGNYETNPSYDSLRALDDTIYEGLDIRIIELPVLWDVSWDLLEAAIHLLNPKILIGTGMAYDDYMRLETVAKNKQYGADNNGVNRDDDPIYTDGPATLSTGLPVEEMKTAMQNAGYNAQITNNAGTYLCNFIFYHIMYYINYQTTDNIVGGFIHVPPAPYDDTTFTIEDITEAHKAGLKAIVDWMESGDESQIWRIDSTEEPVYFR